MLAAGEGSGGRSVGGLHEATGRNCSRKNTALGDANLLSLHHRSACVCCGPGGYGATSRGRGRPSTGPGVRSTLRDEYSIEAAVGGFGDKGGFLRLSHAVYNNDEEFERLRDAVSELSSK